MTQRRTAFTLIESLLAISIAATVLLTLLALLPAGLDASREAARCTAEARILARLRQQCAVSVLSGDFYFDAAGRPLPSRTANAAFAARIATAAGVTMPGDSTASLRCIRILFSARMVDDPFADAKQVRVQQMLLAPAATGGTP